MNPKTIITTLFALVALTVQAQETIAKLYKKA